MLFRLSGSSVNPIGIFGKLILSSGATPMSRRSMRFWGLDYALRNMGITGGFGDRIRVVMGLARRNCRTSVRPLGLPGYEFFICWFGGGIGVCWFGGCGSWTAGRYWGAMATTGKPSQRLKGINSPTSLPSMRWPIHWRRYPPQKPASA